MARSSTQRKQKQTHAELNFSDTEPWYPVAGWSPALCCQLAGLPAASPGTEHLMALQRLLSLFLALYGAPLHNENCFGCASLAFLSLSPSDFPEKERERGAGQSWMHHSRRGNTIILASWMRGILVLYLKKSRSLCTSGFCSQLWSGFSLSLPYLLRVSMPQSLFLWKQGCNIFPCILKVIGVVKDLDTWVQM